MSKRSGDPYQRTVAGYLKVEPLRDVIERPIDDALDIAGWDVRKALGLLARSNASLIEWLASPVRYRWNAPATARLANFAAAVAEAPALAYHYEHQAARSIGEITAADTIRLKTYCYALRPALALVWLRRRGEPPPMNLRALLAGVDVSRDVWDAINDLLARKENAKESAAAPRIPVLDRFIGDVLGSGARSARPVRRPDATAQADALFASMVLEAHAAPPSSAPRVDPA